jgi:hypothetical protein
VKDFLTVSFDPRQCREELMALRALLASKAELEENQDIKPFFETHQHLSANSLPILHVTYDELCDDLWLFMESQHPVYNAQT